MSERTLTGFAVLLQSGALKQPLRPYCLGGPYGRLLDAEAERLGQADVQAFETEGLIGTGAASAVLAYLFHRIEGRLDGRPTLLIVDEGWLVLDEFSFGAQLREWLKTLRKKNASVVFATQSLADIERSPIAPPIIESCLTRLFLPNDRAIEPQIAAIYRRFGLNDRQIEILARATPKRDYYCQSARGARLFELGFGDVALAFCAASSKADQAAIAEALSQHGRAGFAAAWLRRKGLGWAADLLAAEPSSIGKRQRSNFGDRAMTCFCPPRAEAKSNSGHIRAHHAQSFNCALPSPVDRLRSLELRPECTAGRPRARTDQSSDHGSPEPEHKCCSTRRAI